MTRYTVSFSDQPSSKARYRTALKLMGATDIRMSEAEVDATAPKPKRDNLPTSEEARAVASLYGRSYETPWTDNEVALFKTARKTGALSMENMKLISVYYTAERKKGRDGIYRRDLVTFLNNASTELDRAREAKPRNGHALEWSPAPVIVALPNPDETERIRLAALAHAAEFKRAHG